jgi:glutathione synthase
MSDIAFLLGDTRIARNDNHQRLPAAFTAAGWRVALLPQEAVRLDPDGVWFGAERPEHFDLVWLLGLGRAETFFDRMQLLRQLPQERFVTRVDAFVYLHAKYRWWRHMPETYAANDAAYLKSVLYGGGAQSGGAQSGGARSGGARSGGARSGGARSGDAWIVKPSAGSYGRDVQLVGADAAGEAAIERMTAGGSYCVLQRFVPAIAAGEKRTLVAGGRVIGSYLRLAEADFRTNLAHGATAQPTTLHDGERALVETVAGELLQEGVGFAAVDTVFPYLIEVNLANPGGLATLAALYGRDCSGDVAAALVAAHGLAPQVDGALQ